MSITAIEPALYTHLSANGGLAALVENRIYHLQAPQAAPLPYVTFAQIEGGYDDRSPRRGLDLLIEVAGIVNTRADGAALADAIQAALTDTPLTISGWAVYDTRVEKVVPQIINQEGSQRFRYNVYVRIRADSNT